MSLITSNKIVRKLQYYVSTCMNIYDVKQIQKFCLNPIHYPKTGTLIIGTTDFCICKHKYPIFKVNKYLY